jgi:Flp pilus assembly protein TadG
MRTRNRRIVSQRGAALVETAVALPMVAVLLAGTADFARVFYTAIELTNAARAGAQYGAQNLGQSRNTDAMEATARHALNLDGVTATATQTCECASADGLTFIATSPTANNCSAPVATSCPTSGTHRVVSVSVTVRKQFTTISRFSSGPGYMNLVRSATLRVTE